MDRQATLSNRLESPITSNLDTLQAKKNFSVSHLLDLEEAGEMVGSQADEGVGEAGRSMLESPGLTSGSDTTQQESKLPTGAETGVRPDLMMNVCKSDLCVMKLHLLTWFHWELNASSQRVDGPARTGEGSFSPPPPSKQPLINH